MIKTLLDTNIVLRLLLNDNKNQVAKAQEIIDEKDCVVTTPVLAECVYVLDSYYEFPRNSFIKVKTFFEISDFEVEEREINLLALKVFSETKFDFVDLYILCRSIHHNVEFSSFDLKLNKFANNFGVKSDLI